MPENAALFTEQQLKTLTAICDALAPSLNVSPDPGGLYARKASDIGVAQAVADTIRTVGEPTDRTLARLALILFDQPIINAIFGGPFRPFTRMTPDEQIESLRLWAESPLEIRRRAFQAFKRTALFFFYTLLDEHGCNPNWQAIGYPGPPQVTPPQDKPIKPLQIMQDTALTADVVIVGSGAGGGVMAGELTVAGLDVIVLEKGGYYSDSDFTGREIASAQHLFERQGFLTTSDLGVVVLAGSTLGGGTTINWCASFRTPDRVLQEWEHVYGVTGFTGKEYQKCLDAVAARINVNENESIVNAQNAVLRQGAQALGYEVGTIPRNVNGCGDCGFCNYGCRIGSKQGTLRTYLQDAYNRGARIIVNAEADRVLIERGEAVGVEATVQSANGAPAKLTIRSKAIVSAAGTLHTPALLMRSGLTNANIGRNLHLHPTSVSYGLYPQPIEGWRGVLMSRYVPQFNDLDGHGYGFALETAPVHPGIASLVLSWSSGQQHKRVMSRLSSLANIIVITRDRDGGHITLNKQGRPVLHYSLSDYDSAHLMRGIVESLRIHRASGAEEVSGPHTTPYTYRPAEGGDFEAFLRGVQAVGLRKNGFAQLSAHQMSSCRMAANPAHGALDPTGETFEVRNLFVADGSALPTSTGVNPMLTIMGVANYIAQQVKGKLKH